MRVLLVGAANVRRIQDPLSRGRPRLGPVSARRLGRPDPRRRSPRERRGRRFRRSSSAASSSAVAPTRSMRGRTAGCRRCSRSTASRTAASSTAIRTRSCRRGSIPASARGLSEQPHSPRSGFAPAASHAVSSLISAASRRAPNAGIVPVRPLAIDSRTAAAVRRVALGRRGVRHEREAPLQAAVRAVGRRHPARDERRAQETDEQQREVRHRDREHGARGQEQRRRDAEPPAEQRRADIREERGTEPEPERRAEECARARRRVRADVGDRGLRIEEHGAELEQRGSSGDGAHAALARTISPAAVFDTGM